MFSIITTMRISCAKQKVHDASGAMTFQGKILGAVIVMESLLSITAFILGILGATEVISRISSGASYALMGVGGLDFFILASIIIIDSRKNKSGTVNTPS